MFKEQVTLSVQVPTFFYIIGCIAIMLAIAGVFLFDAGLSRKGNVLHTLTQKFAAAFLGGAAMSLFGFAIWDWQFNKAFGVPNPFGEAVKQWWLGGSLMTDFPQKIDPAVLPGADSFQAFFAIFIVFAAFFASLLAGAVIERVKTRSLLICTTIFAALVIPFAGYLYYGPVGPLSNDGTHEFGGAFFYLLLGIWALVLAWRAKPRPGVFSPDRAGPPIPHNLALTLVGLTFFIAGLCGYVLVNGFLVPGEGFFGINLNESGMGIVITNLMMAVCGGVLGGWLAWKVGKHPYFFFVSPVAGWIGVSCMIDLVKPWQALIVAFFAPLLVVVGYRIVERLKIDEPKVVPLTILPGIYSGLVTAIFATNVHQGGYPGLEGDYEIGHATIDFGHQLLGVAATVGLGLASALIVVLAVEKTLGLREKKIDEGFADSLDATVIGDVAYPEVAPPAFHGDAPADEPDMGIGVQTP